jgi:hypothetical protein
MPTPMRLPWQVRKGWQEAKHPRQPTGEHGGEFTSGGATGAATATTARPNPALDEFMAQTPTPRPKAPAGESRPNPDLDEAFGAARPRQTKPAAGEPPPPKPGHVRLYHGGHDPGSGGGRWVTGSREYAQGYADKSGGQLHYADVPASHPEVSSRLDELEESIGSRDARHIPHFEAPEDIARQLKPHAAAATTGPPPRAAARAKPAAPAAPRPPRTKPPAPKRGTAQPPPLPQHSAAPALPHERTQAAAVGALKQAVASARSGGPDAARHKAAALQALDAHRRAGFEAIARMATAKYGDTPKAKVSAMRARAAFTLKLHKAKAKLEAMTGGVPTRGPGIDRPPAPPDSAAPRRPAPAARLATHPAPIRRLNAFLRSDRFRRMDPDEQSQYRRIAANYRTRGRYNAADLTELLDSAGFHHKAFRGALWDLVPGLVPPWCVTKAAHDVSGESRDDKGEWTAGGGKGEAVSGDRPAKPAKKLSPERTRKEIAKLRAMQRYYQPASDGWNEYQAEIDKLASPKAEAPSRSRSLTVSLSKIHHDELPDNSPPLADNRRMPLLVEVKDDGGLSLIDGYHRLAGLKAAGAKSARVILVGKEDLTNLEGMKESDWVRSVYTKFGYDVRSENSAVKAAGLPWLVLKRKDASGHDHRGDGKFGTGAGEAPGETHSSASGGTPYSRKPAGYDRKPGQ